jgi:hypothetical protein
VPDGNFSHIAGNRSHGPLGPRGAIFTERTVAIPLHDVYMRRSRTLNAGLHDHAQFMSTRN